MAGAKVSKDGALDSSAIRIRDNQRRSRARRKEYLEDIQKRLQAYEREGVQATLDMQHAARDVAIENERLRMLLNRRGVTDNEIAQFLQSSPANPPELEKKPLKAQATSTPQSPPQQPGNVRPKMALLPLPLNQTPPSSGVQQLLMPPAIDHAPGAVCSSTYYSAAMRTPPEYVPPSQQPLQSYMDVVLPPIHALAGTEDPAVDKLAVLAHASTRQDCCGDKTQCTTSVEVSQAPSPAATSGSSGHTHSTSPVNHAVHSPTEMSCSQAAQIIADMQGHGDVKLSKVALGCNGREHCVVKNSTIFQVLEGPGPV